MREEESLLNSDIYKKILADYIHLQNEIDELKKEYDKALIAYDQAITLNPHSTVHP